MSDKYEIITEEFDPTGMTAELTYGDDSDDEFYDPAYDYALDELEYSEEDADAFANLVSAFFEVFYSEELDSTMDEILEKARIMVDLGSTSLGLEPTDEEMCDDVMEYLSEYFDFEFEEE